MRKSQRKITYIPDSGELDTAYCSGRDLMDATKAVVSTLSRNAKATVTFAGDEAYTDGQHVVLPALPDNATITKRQGLVTGGFANHEMLHNVLTEFDGETEEMCRRWNRDGRELTSALANAMEDVRIEMGGRDLYNGLPKAIDHTSHEVNQQFLDNYASGNIPADAVSDFGQIGAVAITWEGRRRLGYPSDTMQKCLDLLSDDVRRKVNTIVDAVQHLETGVRGMGDIDTEAAYRGCRELHKLAERIADDYQTQRRGGGNGNDIDFDLTADNEQATRRTGRTADSQDNGDAQREGDKGTSGGSSDADPTSPTGTGDQGSGEGQSDNRTQETDSGTEPSHQDVSRGDLRSGDDKPTTYEQSSDAIETAWERDNCKGVITGELVKALDKVVADIHSQRVEGGKYLVLTRDADCWQVAPKDKTKFNDGIKVTKTKNLESGDIEYGDRLKQMGNKIGTMRRKLERALVSQKRSRYAPRKRHGRLDTNKLTSIIRFDPLVFRHKVMDDSINTAVSICVDLSGSMRGGEISLATDCSIAIAEALQGTGVELEITGHNTAGATVMYRSETGRKYHRKSAIRMTMFKSFDTPLQRARGALGQMPYSAGASNADGDAWVYAVDRLLQRPEQRKIFIAMSDGRPAYRNDYGNESSYKHTRDVVEWMTLNGVDVVGIGIGDDCVKQFFPRYVVVQRLDDLSKHVMDQLGKMLLGERFVVDNSDLIATGRRDAQTAR